MNIIIINDDILHNILNFLDIEDIYLFLLTSDSMKMRIINNYQQYKINLTSMPIFRECNDIMKYLKHYNSFILGKNFPAHPLWLFNGDEDYRFIKHDNKYEKNKTIIMFSKKSPDFTTGYYYYTNLNSEQKYLLWCAITETHPEITLDYNIHYEKNLMLLLFDNNRYDYSFSHMYIFMFLDSHGSLINAKNEASRRIEDIYEIFKNTYFKKYLEQKISENPNFNTAQILKLCDKSDIIHFIWFEDCKKYISIIEYVAYKCNDNYHTIIKFSIEWQIMIENILNKNPKDILSIFQNNIDKVSFSFSFSCSHLKIEHDLNKLRNTIKEIKDLEITKNNNLKTSNINYLEHMAFNYNDNVNQYNNVTKTINDNIDIITQQNCIQQ